MCRAGNSLRFKQHSREADRCYRAHNTHVLCDDGRCYVLNRKGVYLTSPRDKIGVTSKDLLAW